MPAQDPLAPEAGLLQGALFRDVVDVGLGLDPLDLGVREEVPDQQALRLGTRDAAMHYRAGMIALALHDLGSARTELRLALAINQFFSIRYADGARQTLAGLDKAVN